MNLRTLNDVFFTLVKRNSDRVMLTREGDTWQHNLRAPVAELGVRHRAPTAILGNTERRSRRHAQRESAGMGGRRFRLPPAGGGRCPHLCHADQRAVSVCAAEFGSAGCVRLHPQAVREDRRHPRANQAGIHRPHGRRSGDHRRRPHAVVPARCAAGRRS